MLFSVITGINNLLLSVLFPNMLLHDGIALFIDSVNFVYIFSYMHVFKKSYNVCLLISVCIIMSICDKLNNSVSSVLILHIGWSMC